MERTGSLTGIRAVAALAVFTYHADYLHGFLGSGSFHLPGTRFGWIGVDLFFVLSGLLMGLVYAERLARPAAKAWKAYLRDRFLRIAPPYYAAILLTLQLEGVLAWLITRPGLILLYAGYGQLFVPAHANDISPVFWTLAIEAQFYLALPLLVPLFRRWRSATLAACIAVALAIRGLRYGHDDNWAGLSLPAFLAHFGLGLAAAGWWRAGKLQMVARRPDAWAAAGLALVAAALLLLLPAGSPWQGSQTLLANVLVRPVVALGFLLVLVSLLAERSVLGRLLAARPFVWLGERSYSLYLTHIAVLYGLWVAYPPRTVAWGAFFWAGLALSLAVAHLFHGLVEGPSLRLRDRLAGPRVRQPVPAPAAA
ncbi:MAG: hypothetical protein QOI63_395 [Thermoplasmata archaeon]|nr:hypothetical protein [Thermoplasmata archaeon]